MNKRTMADIEKMAFVRGLTDFKWIRPSTILFGEWVRMKCLYGCPGYGKRKTCPPYVPSVAECMKFFQEYRHGLFFHIARKFKDPAMRHPWAKGVNQQVLDLEKEVFLAGCHKAYSFPPAPCRGCRNCKGGERECRRPYLSRPTLEAFGVDVFGTARKMGYPLYVLKDYQEEMNRYGLLLVE